jgi:hypothetical protein
MYFSFKNVFFKINSSVTKEIQQTYGPIDTEIPQNNVGLQNPLKIVKNNLLGATDPRTVQLFHSILSVSNKEKILISHPRISVF